MISQGNVAYVCRSERNEETIIRDLMAHDTDGYFGRPTAIHPHEAVANEQERNGACNGQDVARLKTHNGRVHPRRANGNRICGRVRPALGATIC